MRRDTVLFASGSLAILLLAGAGCSKPIVTQAVPAETTPLNEGDCLGDGKPVKCEKLLVSLRDHLTLSERADLELALIAQGVKVQSYAPIEWHLSISSTTSSEIGTWEGKSLDRDFKKELVHIGFVYFDGSKLSMTPASFPLTNEEELKARQLPGYVGEFNHDVFGLQFQPKVGFDQVAEAVLKAFVAEGVQVGRVDVPYRTVILPDATTSDQLRGWHDKLLKVPNVARVDYVSAVVQVVN